MGNKPGGGGGRGTHAPLSQDPAYPGNAYRGNAGNANAGNATYAYDDADYGPQVDSPTNNNGGGQSVASAAAAVAASERLAKSKGRGGGIAKKTSKEVRYRQYAEIDALEKAKATANSGAGGSAGGSSGSFTGASGSAGYKPQPSASASTASSAAASKPALSLARSNSGGGGGGGGGGAPTMLGPAKPYESEAEAAVRFERLAKFEKKTTNKDKPQVKAQAVAGRASAYEQIAKIADQKQAAALAAYDAALAKREAAAANPFTPFASFPSTAAASGSTATKATASATTASAPAKPDDKSAGASGGSSGGGSGGSGGSGIVFDSEEMLGSAEYQVDTALGQVLKASPATVSLVKGILEKLVDPPAGKDPAVFRRIKLSVKRVQELIVGVPGVVDMLCALGFVQTGPTVGDPEKYLEFPAAQSLELVSVVLGKMVSIVEAQPNLARVDSKP